MHLKWNCNSRLIFYFLKKINDCLIDNYSNNVSSFHTINLINKTYYYVKEMSITFEVLKNSCLIAYLKTIIVGSS